MRIDVNPSPYPLAVSLFDEESVVMSRSLVKKVLFLLLRALVRSTDFLVRNPVLYRGRHVSLVYFGVFTAVCSMVIAAIFTGYVQAKGFGLHSLWLDMLLILGGIVLFAKVFSYIPLGKDFFRNTATYLKSTSFFNQGGMLGGFLALGVISHMEGVPLLVLADALAYGAMAGLFFGRLGCLNYGCCHGRPIRNRDIGVIYENPDAKALRLTPKLKDVPLYPTQILTAVFNLSLFFIFSLMIPFLPFDGFMAFLFLFIYNAFRLWIDRYRYMDYPGRYRITSLIAAAYFWIGCVAVLGSVAAYWGGWIGPAMPFAGAAGGVLRQIAASPENVMVIAMTGVMAFLVYGVHGKTLGKHFG